MQNVEARIKSTMGEIYTEVDGVTGYAISTLDGLPIVVDVLDSDVAESISAVISSMAILAEKTTSRLKVGGYKAIIVDADDGKLFIFQIEDIAILAIIAKPDISTGLLLLKAKELSERIRDLLVG